MSAVLFGIIFISFVFLLLAIYQSSVATHVLFGLISIVQAIFTVWVYCYYDAEIRRAIIDAIKRNKPTNEQGKFQPYWSSSNWQQSNEIPDIQEGTGRPQPTRFLDESIRRSNLTPQTFNPDSIPMTALEKKRLKITVNGDAVREAKLVENKLTDDTPVSTGFSTQVVMDANGNGFINPVVIPEPDYSDNSDAEDEANFVTAQEIELVRDEDDTAL